MSIESIYAEAALSASRRAPEGVSITVVIPERVAALGDEAIEALVREAALALFPVFHPDRIPGAVLHVEYQAWIDTAVQYEVVVQDRGAR